MHGPAEIAIGALSEREDSGEWLPLAGAVLRTQPTVAIFVCGQERRATFAGRACRSCTATAPSNVRVVTVIAGRDQWSPSVRSRFRRSATTVTSSNPRLAFMDERSCITQASDERDERDERGVLHRTRDQRTDLAP